jgi:hypothetical protein
MFSAPVKLMPAAFTISESLGFRAERRRDGIRWRSADYLAEFCQGRAEVRCFIGGL